MLLGLVGAIGNGMTLPIITLMGSKFFNHFGNWHCSSISSPEFIDKVNEYSLILLYQACGVFLASFLDGYCWTRTGERQASRMRARYLQAILRQDVEYFDLKMSSSVEVINCISNDSSIIQDVITEKVSTFVSRMSAFFSSYIVAFIMSWNLAVVVTPMAFLVVIPSLLYGKKLINIAKKTSQEFNNASIVAEQAISSVRTVYSFSTETQILAKYCSMLDKTVKLGLRQSLAKGHTIGCTGIIYIIWAFLFWYGSHLVMYHGVEGGTIYGIGCANFIAFVGLRMAIPNLSYFSEARVAAGKIMEVILRAPKIETDSNEGETFENVMGNVEFKLVKFAYPSRPESLILNNFNLKVSAGKSLALVGSSGAGKSTIISLLERFYDPVAGEIFLDGVDIRMLNLKWLRSQIGLVSQEPALFATSIKENILLAKANATMEEIFEAAKVANAHDFITQLPHQYDTQVGEGGIQISGGQKQRIAIARAVLMSPKILLLDEATSALDTESERVVQAALNQVSVNRTTVIIAHRLSTIRDVNTIAVMQSGQITEIGSHDELINKDNGIYASLIHHQQANARKATSNRAHSSLQLDQKNFSYSQQKHNALFGFAGNSDGMQVQQPERPSLPSFSRLLMLNKPEWRNAVMGSIGAIFVGACQPIYGYILGFMISVYFLNDHSEIKSKLRIFSFMFLALFVVYFVMSGLQHYNFGAMGERLTKRLREEMLAKILSFEVAWFDKEDNSTGAICSLLAKDANVARSLVSDRMSLLLQTITTVAISSAIGLFISWRMALVLLAMQPLMISSFYIRYVLMKSLSSKAIKSQAIICKLAAEAISNFRTVAAFSAQDQVISMFKVAQEGPQRENIRQSWFAGAACAASSSVLVGSWAINYWYGGKLMSQMLITAKTFFETSLVLITIARVIADAASMTSDIAKGADSVGMVFAILDRKSCIEPEEAVGHKPKKLAGYIDIQGVHFSYPSRPEVLIFNDFSISIEAGKSTAFIGKSGSGKSTIIALIERFYDPLKGTIMIDGKDIKSYDLRSLRRHIGLVSQEPTLFSGTIRENIVYGTNSATQMEVEYASRAANAHDFISSLKDGYDTFCGDNGTQLSGGQKQRIAIARAILRNPEILLLDEATSALDSQSEKVVQEALERMMVNRTSVVVAHRLGTIKNCDLIVVLDKGVVVEKGTHASLLGKGPIGSYYSLVSLQHGNESQMHAAP